MTHVSLVVPTFNRAEFLQTSLPSFVDQSLQPSSYEIIVVDNNSTDATKETTHALLESSPVPWSYLFEPRQGLHYARNRGILEAKGEIVVFGDDDITADRRWLECFVEEFASHVRTGVAGGPIRPNWQGAPEPWVFDYGSAQTHPVFAILELGDERRVLEQGYVVGCNFAIRRKLAIAVGGSQPDTFPPDLIHLSGQGENGMIDAVRAEGYDIIYLPDASISHRVESARATPEYFKYRYERWAVEEVYRQFRRHAKPVALAVLLKNAAKRLLLVGRRSARKQDPAVFRTVERAALRRTIRQALRVLVDRRLHQHITKCSYLET